MRLPLPRSLRARLILFTLGTIFLVQAATIATASYYRKKVTNDVTVDVTATTIRTLRAALAEIPAEERSDFVQKASQNEWHLWSRSLPADHRLGQYRHEKRDAAHRRDPLPLPNDLRDGLRSFVRALNARLGDDTRVGLSRGPKPQLYISLIAGEQEDDPRYNREWLVIPLDRLGHSDHHRLAGRHGLVAHYCRRLFLAYHAPPDPTGQSRRPTGRRATAARHAGRAD